MITPEDVGKLVALVVRLLVPGGPIDKAVEIAVSLAKRLADGASLAELAAEPVFWARWPELGMLRVELTEEAILGAGRAPAMPPIDWDDEPTVDGTEQEQASLGFSGIGLEPAPDPEPDS